MTLAQRKRDLRREMRMRTASVSSTQAQRAGERAAERLATTPEFRSAVTLALFAARPDEIATRPIYELARGEGKRCLFPRCPPGDGGLQLAAIDRWDALSPGRYGILEPPWGSPSCPLEPSDLVAVPGLAFDRLGNRLGRGAGYYDRFLASGDAKGALAIGLCLACQVVAEVPAGPADQRMYALLSEGELLRCGA